MSSATVVMELARAEEGFDPVHGPIERAAGRWPHSVAARFGEQSLSYFSQLFAIMWLQFVSAATGIAAVTALCRGLAGRTTLGNFYQDLWRATGLLLLPLALLNIFLTATAIFLFPNFF